MPFSSPPPFPGKWPIEGGLDRKQRKHGPHGGKNFGVRIWLDVVKLFFGVSPCMASTLRKGHGDWDTAMDVVHSA